MILYKDDIQNIYNCVDILGKIKRLIKQEKLFRLKKGLYEDNRNVDPSFLASFIHNPSYLSFEYALSYYGLIPERVTVYTSASVGNRKTKEFINIFGIYNYSDIPESVFEYGLDRIKVDGYIKIIATPEKALCDKLYKMKPIKNIKELKQLLFEDLRIDKELLFQLDYNNLNNIASLYNSTNLKHLVKYIERNFNEFNLIS